MEKIILHPVLDAPPPSPLIPIGTLSKHMLVAALSCILVAAGLCVVWYIYYH